MMNIDNLINEYKLVSEQVNALKVREEELKAQITKAMLDNNVDVYETEDGESVAQLQGRTTFKYKNEDKIINYLKENKLERYIVEKVATTFLNDELKKGGVLTESSSEWYERNVSYSIKTMTKEEFAKKSKKK